MMGGEHQEAIGIQCCGDCHYFSHYHHGMDLEIAGYLCQKTGIEITPNGWCDQYEPEFVDAAMMDHKHG